MGIEVTEGGVIIDGEHVELYRFLMIRRGLKIQAETGMKLTRVSCLRAAQNAGLTTKRTAAAAYREVDALFVSAGMDSAGPLRPRT